MQTDAVQPVFFLSHGGGPWPWLDGPMRTAYAKLEACLRALPASLPQTPRAAIFITAHWEAPQFTLSAGANPGMLYDYGGFPPHTYQISYPAPGAPELAQEVCASLQAGGLRAALDHVRGYDHGVFTPAAVIWPQAQMPILQISLQAGLDPAAHLQLGRLLAPLRAQGVLIIASGLSYHNLRNFGPGAASASAQFDAWLQEACCRLAGEARNARLCDWRQAPAAMQAHPREEHLIPLLCAAGAAQEDAAQCCYHETDFVGGVVVSSFRFG
ncbi:class III extradiol ring-cleavage dioxygenase [Massilia sp. W12]|uniref:DODA-type extradiol aromatic ring-opening family dioxygenase n=1 Tax=Massilia sp. W12 TaxID=3126507 RepID=UPI0030CB1AA6